VIVNDCEKAMLERPTGINCSTINYSLSISELMEQIRPAGANAWAAIMALGGASDENQSFLFS
jgi:hypothetical protein